MKIMGAITALALLAGSAGAAAADPWKDESGKGRWGGYERGDDGWRGERRGRHARGEYKEEYRMGGCKIERKWERGGYKEETKCKARLRAGLRLPLLTAGAAHAAP